MSLKKLQKTANQLMADLPDLDFEDVSALIDWLEALTEPSNNRQIIIDWRLVVDTFQRNGFMADAKTDSNFDSESGESAARYLIGQALNTLGGVYNSGHYVPQVFPEFAREWRRRFPHLTEPPAKRGESDRS